MWFWQSGWRHETRRGAQLATAEPRPGRVGEDSAPTLACGQLLRILRKLAEEAGDVREHASGPSGLGVRAGHAQRGLPGVAAALCDGGQAAAAGW